MSQHCNLQNRTPIPGAAKLQNGILEPKALGFPNLVGWMSFATLRAFVRLDGFPSRTSRREQAAVIESFVENRRRRYLARMGLKPYYARKVLENAGPSPVIARAEEELRSASASSGAAVEVSPRQDPVAAPAALTEPNPELAVGGTKLHYRCIDSSLAVLTQDHWQGEGGAGCAALLQNICKALGKEFDSEAAAETAICALPADCAQASAASLDQLCRRDGCSNLLVFAHNGAELFPGVSPAGAEFVRHIGGVDIRVTLTRGLREMLAFPDLKKYCWKDLQPLRRRLPGKP